jgi:hypothetical protein
MQHGPTATVTSRAPPVPPATAQVHSWALAEKILTSSTLEGERKQVTVLFAELKGSMELLPDRDSEEARQILDPLLECIMAQTPMILPAVDAVQVPTEGGPSLLVDQMILASFEQSFLIHWAKCQECSEPP